MRGGGQPADADDGSHVEEHQVAETQFAAQLRFGGGGWNRGECSMAAQRGKREAYQPRPSARLSLALPRQSLRQEHLEKRLIWHIALVRQNFQILDHGNGEPQRYGLVESAVTQNFRSSSSLLNSGIAFFFVLRIDLRPPRE